MLLYFSAAWGTTFTNVSAGSGVAGDGTGAPGNAVADFNGDGLPDILALSDPHLGTGPQLLIQNTTSLTFTDRTATLAPGFSARNASRVAIPADMNNDGLRDVVLSEYSHVAIYLQRDDGTFGTASGADFQVVDTQFADQDEAYVEDGFNVEGIGIFDPDHDGVLDIQTGWRFARLWDPLRNPAIEIGADGLPSDEVDSDYLQLGDIDGDGLMDMVVGRGGSNSQDEDVFFGETSGWRPEAHPSFDAYDRKGAILMCDFDLDQDLDLFRTIRSYPAAPPVPHDQNTFWLYDVGGFSLGGMPTLNVGEDTWSAACGDIDNDSDLDLVLSYFQGGVEIFRNTGTGWVADAGGVVTDGVVGLALADLDLDGDLDLFLNREGDNQIWRNDLNDQRFLSVEVSVNVGTCEAPVLRDDYHAQYWVHDSGSGLQTPRYAVRDSSGAGVGIAQPTHVGLGNFNLSVFHRITVESMARQADGSPIPLGFRNVNVTNLDASHHVVVRSDDVDNDHIPIEVEGVDDPDGDGLGNYTDWDSDGDRISDHTEAGGQWCDPVDTDLDGTPDFLDTDSDGDLVPDADDCDRLDPLVGDPLPWFEDVDQDGFGDQPLAPACTAPTGAVGVAGDCDDDDASVFPGAPEMCGGVDSDCDGDPDAGAVDGLVGFLDADTDGHGDPTSSITGCTLPPGYVVDGDDCNDAEPLQFPGNPEVCDGLDNDCDSEVDGPTAVGAIDFFLDADNDGFGAGTPTLACTQPAGYRAVAGDCDDAVATINPGAPEQCNGLDDDCDLDLDEGVAEVTWYRDEDGDNHGGTETAVGCAQPTGFALNPGDCDDDDPAINPLALEVCNGIDDNCANGETDAVDAPQWHVDADQDGWGALGSGTPACEQPLGTVSQSGDCDDADPQQSPVQPEACDGLDNDCNLLVDDNAFDAVQAWPDEDADGRGDASTVAAFCTIPSGWVGNDLDCDDDEPFAWTDAPESCDGVDNDCDGLLDQEDPDMPDNATLMWYPDQDGDGVGAGQAVEICTPPAGHVLVSGDCDDADPTRFPGAVEVPDNGIDEDCDGADQVLDPDSDGDGLPDSQEPPGDFDGDGIDNVDDPDSDNDGVPDGAEPTLEAVTSSGEASEGLPPQPAYGCETASAPWKSMSALWIRRTRTPRE